MKFTKGHIPWNKGVKGNFTTPNDIDFKKCWALENLRPLEQRKNASKGKKLINLMEIGEQADNQENKNNQKIILERFK